MLSFPGFKSLCSFSDPEPDWEPEPELVSRHEETDEDADGEGSDNRWLYELHVLCCWTYLMFGSSEVNY